MKLTVARRDLHDALGHVGRIVEARHTIPILANILLRAEDDKLTLFASDLDIEVRTSCTAAVDEDGEITVPASRLRDWVSKLKDGPVTMTLNDHILHLAAGRAEAALPTLPAADFPSARGPERDGTLVTFGLPVAALAQAIDATAFAIADDPTRPFLDGIHFHAAGEVLTIVATDGHRLSLWRTAMPTGAERLPPIILPRKPAAEMSRLAKAGEGTARIEATDRSVRVTIGDTVLTSKLVDATYPDYARVIPIETALRHTFDSADLSAAIDRALTVTAAKTRGIRIDWYDESATVTVRDQDIGSQATETVAVVDAAGGDVSIGFNGRYVQDALASLPDGAIECGTHDPGAPSVWRPATPAEGAPERLVVIMPMRV